MSARGLNSGLCVYIESALSTELSLSSPVFLCVLLQRFFSFMCIYVPVYITCVQVPVVGSRFSVAGIIAFQEQPIMGIQEQNSCVLKEQQALLTAKPSLQPWFHPLTKM